ncbi:MAG: hypothetical protein N3D82_03600 [Ignisphaera sp.]|nr:hypothetical protein [Ignisphaera sp.]MCX8168091.1 hypothetical protein [Ignisphaera sp.]MDW8085915.1 hypothetical protein [Ignisphaera sp.]
MDFNVIKALFYTCSSYPKIAAPHRFSPFNDFELCTLTSLSSTLDNDLNVRKYIEELKKGLRSIDNINLGESLAQGLQSSLRNVGSNAMIEVSIASTMILYINYIVRLQHIDFHESVRYLYRAMSLNNTSETLSFVKALKNFGKEMAALIDRAEIAERKIALENMKLSDVFQTLSKISLKFEAFANMHKIFDVLNTVEDIARTLNDINSILSRLSLLLALGERSTKSTDYKSLGDILRMDIEYRKKNMDKLYIIPYIMFASLYMVVTKGY